MSNAGADENVRPHDLLAIGGAADLVCDEVIPAWVADALRRVPVVVVRRGRLVAGLVPVGIRGPERHQRFAAHVHLDRVSGRDGPEDLVAAGVLPSPERVAAVPALAAYLRVREAWAGITRPWGPVGSVGFELSTGHPTANASSDLDVILRAPERFPPVEGRALMAPVDRIGTTIDVRVETGSGSFALREFCEQGPAGCLVKSAAGIRLAVDPWSRDPGEQK